MCGIILEINYDGGKSISLDEKIKQRVCNRGPDCVNTLVIEPFAGVQLSFVGAVLWMQGPVVTPQPLENDNGVLLYNGDIFDATWDKNLSDTQIIMNRLSQCISAEEIILQLKSLKGPFSIIYFDKQSKSLFYLRDRLGRNSLLFHKNENYMVISNVLGRQYNCIEIPAMQIHVLNLITKEIRLHFWMSDNVKSCFIDEWLTEIQKAQSLPDEEFKVEIEVKDEFLDEDEIISYIEKQAKEITCKFNFMKKLLQHDGILKTVIEVTELLKQSVRIRLITQPQKCKLCLHTATICNHCTVGILFSGGLDCTIIAFLANYFLDTNQSIELINVAFKKDQHSFDVPDRITGRKSFHELKRICPNRKWIFKEVNVPKEELELYQNTHIADVVYPRQTILDESLGSALWFAARGQDNHSTSPCRVLLVGSGADELFGGYTRHRNAFKRLGWPGLHKELMLDWSRISFRNLARDNRVICDHGRQPRMPYLDEDFTNYVLGLKPWLKCYPNEALGQGVGDKLMLRLVALNLGLTEVATYPKRALQFGSRIANKKEKGRDISKTFMAIKNL